MRPCDTATWLLAFALMLARQAVAEDGYDLWLRYRPLPAAQAIDYRAHAAELVLDAGSPVRAAARIFSRNQTCAGSVVRRGYQSMKWRNLRLRLVDRSCSVMPCRTRISNI